MRRKGYVRRWPGKSKRADHGSRLAGPARSPARVRCHAPAREPLPRWQKITDSRSCCCSRMFGRCSVSRLRSGRPSPGTRTPRCGYRIGGWRSVRCRSPGRASGSGAWRSAGADESWIPPWKVEGTIPGTHELPEPVIWYPALASMSMNWTTHLAASMAWILRIVCNGTRLPPEARRQLCPPS